MSESILNELFLPITMKKISKKEIELIDNLLARSTLTEKDAEEIGHKIKHEMNKRFRQ